MSVMWALYNSKLYLWRRGPPAVLAAAAAGASNRVQVIRCIYDIKPRCLQDFVFRSRCLVLGFAKIWIQLSATFVSLLARWQRSAATSLYATFRVRPSALSLRQRARWGRSAMAPLDVNRDYDVCRLIELLHRENSYMSNSESNADAKTSKNI